MKRIHVFKRFHLLAQESHTLKRSNKILLGCFLLIIAPDIAQALFGSQTGITKTFFNASTAIGSVIAILWFSICLVILFRCLFKALRENDNKMNA